VWPAAALAVDSLLGWQYPALVENDLIERAAAVGTIKLKIPYFRVTPSGYYWEPSIG